MKIAASVQDMPLLNGHLHVVSVKEARPAGTSLPPCIVSWQLSIPWIYHGKRKTAKPLALTAASQGRCPRKTAAFTLNLSSKEYYTSAEFTPHSLLRTPHFCRFFLYSTTALWRTTAARQSPKNTSLSVKSIS
jgi:hypothetical protein